MQTLTHTSSVQSPAAKPTAAAGTVLVPAARRPTGERIAQLLALIETQLSVVRAWCDRAPVYRAGDTFDSLYVVHAGMFKTVNVSARP